MPDINWQTVSVTVVLGTWVGLMVVGRLVPGSFYRKQVAEKAELLKANAKMAATIERLTRVR